MNIFYGGNTKWNTMIHNGPYFPEPYKQHNIPVIINNRKYIFKNSLVEEYITLYAKYVNTDYHNNSTFKKNFFNDFKKILPKELSFIKSIDMIDMSLIIKHLENIKEKKANMSKEMKQSIKEKRLEIEKPYTTCVINNIITKVGNYRIEPPGIFLGRGKHPKLGKIKKRILPKDVTINIGKDATIPKPNIGGSWGKVIHDKTAVWLASWKDNISGKTKYIFTSMDGLFKSKSDLKKFDLAKKLKNKINSIRDSYLELVNDNDIMKRQIGTVLYLIDNLAIRVGGKKDKDQADTVGATSLRVEHIEFMEDNKIRLDFLGKDSIRYCRKINLDSVIYKNLKEFTSNKNKKEDIFDRVNPSILNKYLDTLMPGLTGKVWRTYMASSLLQKELNKIKSSTIDKIDKNEKINYLIGLFNMANTKVAILCNHQKNVSSNLNNIINKINDRIKSLRKKIKKTKDKDKKVRYQSKIKLLMLKRETKEKMKNVSLGTSKTNYIDPRIIFAFIKKFDIPTEKIFTKTLIERFKWASDVSSKYTF